MKLTTEDILSINNVLSGAKIAKLKDQEKFTVIRILKEFKPTVKSYDEFVKDAMEKLKPEGYEEIEAKAQTASNSLTPKERAAINAFNKSVMACTESELKKEVELSFTLLNESGLKHLMESNDFTIAQCACLYDITEL